MAGIILDVEMAFFFLRNSLYLQISNIIMVFTLGPLMFWTKLVLVLNLELEFDLLSIAFRELS